MCQISERLPLLLPTVDHRQAHVEGFLVDTSHAMKVDVQNNPDTVD